MVFSFVIQALEIGSEQLSIFKTPVKLSSPNANLKAMATTEVQKSSKQAEVIQNIFMLMAIPQMLAVLEQAPRIGL